MPNNTHELSHAAMRMVAADGPLGGSPRARRQVDHPDRARRRNITISSRRTAGPSTSGRRSISIRLDGPEGVVDWFEGSGLRPFLDRLSADESVEFLARYRERLAQAYPRQPNGKVLLRYPRLFFVLQK